MATAYPGALDTSTQQPSPLAATDLDTAGFEHDIVHTNHSGALIALETKMGIGASAASGASDGDALTKQADGSTAWEAVPAGVAWSGSTANGLATYGSGSSVVSESTATYDGTSLVLTTSGGGLKMDGLASSDANTLDDYEEGTAAVTLQSSSGGTITIGGSNTIGYTKIGRVVHIQGELDVASVSGPSGQLNILGMPFTASNTLTDMADRSWLSTSVMNLSSAITAGDTIAMIAANGTTISYFGGGGGSTLDYFADKVDSGTALLVGGSYITDS
jgi:hypothetical protein